LAGALPPDKLRFGCAATAVDPMAKTVQAEDGTRISYDALISTMPLDLLVEKAGLSRLRPAADKLMCSAVHVVGVGLEGQPDPSVADKCWMYFPESNCPFFRVTVFSNYSPNNVPDITRQWSLMAEVSQSPKKPVNEARVVEDVVQGLLNTGLVESRSRISHTFHLRADRAYPTPGLERDAALRELLPALEKMGIYSRGRMGAWKYETGNMDHAMMQGVEVARRLLHGSPELTLWFPNQVNQTHPVYGKDWL
jgi:protoporphyrinogen oxidase